MDDPLTLQELKEKYGDWNNGWRSPGEREKELCEAARAKLIGIVGQEAFDALPEQGSDKWRPPT